MSTKGLYGLDGIASPAVREIQRLADEARAEQEQLDLLEPLTADEIEETQRQLGPGAGLVTVLREARTIKKGRPQGAKNRKTEDFIKYILQFGTDPAITMMQIQSTAPEELVARSRLVDPAKRQMSYADAQALRVRCAEALIPYLHSKQPVAVDATIRGVMVVEEIGGPRSAVIDMDGEPLGILPIDEASDG